MELLEILQIRCAILIFCTFLVGSQTPTGNNNCVLPNCATPTYNHSLGSENIPQIVYFVFDDSVNSRIFECYQRLFHPSRKNPDGCPIAATLMTYEQKETYTFLQDLNNLGFEIGLHSSMNRYIGTKSELIGEITKQKYYINSYGIPRERLVGWRSPFLKTLGNEQINALKELGMKYDISKTFFRRKRTDPNPFPFTTDSPWPYTCNIPPCWNESISNVWEVPINAMFDYKGETICTYADDCYNAPPTEDDFVDYMMSNFNDSYTGNRAPFGIHYHGWRLVTSVKYYRGMDRFIQKLLDLGKISSDIYIVPVVKMLDWMSNPVSLSNIRNFQKWRCLPRFDNFPMPPLPPPEIIEPTTTTEAPPLLDPNNCKQGDTCRLPSCFCKTFDIKHILLTKDTPQIVYFAIDDEVNNENIGYFDTLFTASRKNPNGCAISASFYVSDHNTDYSMVQKLYKKGMEIASHGLDHKKVNTRALLLEAATAQKENLSSNANIPINEIVGWRTPYLETIGDEQVEILQSLNYTYDISYTYTRSQNKSNIWPMTADYGWYDLPCNIPPCLRRAHNGFWEVPINSMWVPGNNTACTYTDSCAYQFPTENEIFEFLKENFLNSYEQNRVPFGIHFHGRWLKEKNNMGAMDRFIKYLLLKDNVYIVSVKKMLEWMRNLTGSVKTSSFVPGQCTKTAVSGIKVFLPSR